MRKRIGTVLAIALTLPLATHLAFGAPVGSRKHRPDPRMLPRSATFIDAGEYTGPLEGTIVINGTAYQLASGVWIYDVRRGPLPSGTFADHWMVACSGLRVGGSNIVSQIIVRPNTDSRVINTDPIRTGKIEDSGPR